MLQEVWSRSDSRPFARMATSRARSIGEASVRGRDEAARSAQSLAIEAETFFVCAHQGLAPPHPPHPRPHSLTYPTKRSQVPIAATRQPAVPTRQPAVPDTCFRSARLSRPSRPTFRARRPATQRTSPKISQRRHSPTGRAQHVLPCHTTRGLPKPSRPRLRAERVATQNVNTNCGPSRSLAGSLPLPFVCTGCLHFPFTSSLTHPAFTRRHPPSCSLRRIHPVCPSPPPPLSRAPSEQAEPE